MSATMERPMQATAEWREAQARWAREPISARLRVVRELRYRVAENATALAASAGSVSKRPVGEKLVSEVLPLADGCRWLERNAGRVLATQRQGSRGRPLWLYGSTFEVHRQPFGIVLVIGPGNYPLFLPAIHSLQALVAGNAVQLKPAPGTRHVALAFHKLACGAGLNPALLTILPESESAAHDAIESGVGKVVFTGSSENGRVVLAKLAETNTPSVMELSGEDPVIVLGDADLQLVVRAFRFGNRLNDGATCIAPRRLLVVHEVAAKLLSLLDAANVDTPPIENVRDGRDAVRRANAGAYGLGATIFSRDIAQAKALAAELKSGFVLINDLIAPTADPRMPFGGVKASGFGSSRGTEGLLEMTFPHVVAVREKGGHPHFDDPAAEDAALFASYIRATQGRNRIGAAREFLGALIAKARNTI